MKNILAMSDLHGRIPKLPRVITSSEIDVLILAGDIAGHGKENWTYTDYFERMVNVPAEAIYQKAWIENTLKPWIDKEVKPKSVIFVNGNHDFGDYEGVFEHYLFMGSKTIAIDGVKIGLLAGSGILVNEWSDEINEDQFSQRIDGIERDVTYLISHVPPHGILDKAHNGDRIGSRALTQAIFGRIGTEPYFTNLKYSIFGHCHENRGKEEHEIDGRKITFLNVAETFATLDEHKGTRVSFHSK